MKLNCALAALLAALVLPVHAEAGVTVTPIGGGGVPLPSLPGFGASSIATFDAIPQTPYGLSVRTAPNPATFSNGGGAWSGDGIVMNNGGQGSLGLYAEPYNDTTNYMAVLSGRSETVTYAKMQSKLGLYWGSIDAYNVLTLYNGLNSIVVPVPPVANGNQVSSDSNRYFVISGFDFNKAVFGSNGNSFEFDNVAVAGAPEPGTWAMMMLGVAGLSLAAFRRGRKNRLEFALA
jgi:hypothetical protein